MSLLIGIGSASPKQAGAVMFGGSSKEITTAKFLEMLQSFGAFNFSTWAARGTAEFDDNQVIKDVLGRKLHLASCTVEVVRGEANSSGDYDKYTIRITTPNANGIADKSTLNSLFIYTNTVFENNGKKAVNARYLHAWLESKQQFANWIQNRIDQYGFVENQDFEVLDNFVLNSENQDFEVFNNPIKNPSGGRPRTEYALSLDMAKELSMVENNPKGKEARQYFIVCEKKLKQVKAATNDVIVFVEGAARMLNLNENSKLLMLQKAADIYGFDKALLPAYTPSKGTLVPLSKILEGTAFSAQKANPILEQKGILEKKWRKSSRGEQVYFWSISDKHIDIGENQVSPSNPRETQPLYYESRKDEILKLIA